MRIQCKSIGQFFISVAFSAFILSGCTEGNSIETKAMASENPLETIGRLVKVIKIEDQVKEQTRVFPGVAQPTRETDLAFRVGGPLIKLDVHVGQKVEKGDIIAKIDPRDFNINVKRLSAAIAEARANLKAMKAGARPEDIASLEADLAAVKSQLDEATSNFKRYDKLLKQEIVAKTAYESVKTAYETAKARVIAAENALTKGRSGARKEDISAMDARIRGMTAEITAAKNALNDTELRAPFDGYVHEKYVENFETIKNGEPIVSLLDLKSTEVRTGLPQSLLSRQENWEEIQVCFESHPKFMVQAVIKEIGQKTEGPGQNFTMVLRIDTPLSFNVHPGTAADVMIRLKDQDTASMNINVPAAAVFAGTDGTPGVWKVIPDTMIIRRIPVQTGHVDADTVQIAGDIAPGDLVVTAGARFLRENQKVRLLNPTCLDSLQGSAS